MKNFPSLHSLIMTPDNDLSFHKDQLAHVLKLPHGYICGMCGKQYTSLSLAWECVTNDTLKFSSFPVTEINNHEGCIIHCLLCGKNYVNAEDAALCTSHDLQHTELPLLLSEHLNAMVIETLKGQKITKRELLNSRQSSVGMKINLTKVTAKPIQTPQKPAGKSTDIEVDPGLRQDQDDILEKSPIEAPPIPEEVFVNEEHEDMENFTIEDNDQKMEIERVHKDKLAITRSLNQTPFVEHDGVYLCNVCMEKYFKKEEVEAHFVQHPLEESE